MQARTAHAHGAQGGGGVGSVGGVGGKGGEGGKGRVGAWRVGGCVSVMGGWAGPFLHLMFCFVAWGFAIISCAG